jgi:hypothetical protein
MAWPEVGCRRPWAEDQGPWLAAVGGQGLAKRVNPLAKAVASRGLRPRRRRRGPAGLADGRRLPAPGGVHAPRRRAVVGQPHPPEPPPPLQLAFGAGPAAGRTTATAEPLLCFYLMPPPDGATVVQRVVCDGVERAFDLYAEARAAWTTPAHRTAAPSNCRARFGGGCSPE